MVGSLAPLGDVNARHGHQTKVAIIGSLAVLVLVGASMALLVGGSPDESDPAGAESAEESDEPSPAVVEEQPEPDDDEPLAPTGSATAAAAPEPSASASAAVPDQPKSSSGKSPKPRPRPTTYLPDMP